MVNQLSRGGKWLCMFKNFVRLVYTVKISVFAARILYKLLIIYSEIFVKEVMLRVSD